MLQPYHTALPLLAIDQAEPEAQAALQAAQAKLGFLPNMYRAMAHHPGLFATYRDGYDRFRATSGFTPTEQEVVFISISAVNHCTYCTAAHAFIGSAMAKMRSEDLRALRSGDRLTDPKLDALARFTRLMVETRGMPSTDAVAAFHAHGYTDQHILPIILAIATKTISNYVNHLFETPIDGMFAGSAAAQ